MILLHTLLSINVQGYFLLGYSRVVEYLENQHNMIFFRSDTSVHRPPKLSIYYRWYLKLRCKNCMLSSVALYVIEACDFDVLEMLE